MTILGKTDWLAGGKNQFACEGRNNPDILAIDFAILCRFPLVYCSRVKQVMMT